MNRKTGSLLCLGMLMPMLLQGITIYGSEAVNYPVSLECKELEDWETPAGVTAQAFEKICDRKFEDALGKTLAGGAIAVISNGREVFSKGYGYADIERKIPFSPSKTVFEYGSVSKLFTWTSAMQMAEQEKLDLSANIDDYLPHDFKRVDDKHKPLTMLQLMNHQGGYDDYLIHLFNRKDNIVSLREALEEHKVSQIYEPGFASSYSNYGSGLAGYVVEEVAGEPLYQYMEREIMKPLGMLDTTMNPELDGSLKRRKTKAYVPGSDGLSEGDWTYVSMYPAGGINGTLDDLARFAKAYLTEDPVIFKKEETFKKMLSPSYQITPEVDGIAHGFIMFDGAYPTFWHNGGTENMAAFMAIVPEADFGIVACGNTEISIDMLESLCFSLLSREKVDLEETEEHLPDVSLLEGDYQDFRVPHKGFLKILGLFQESICVEVNGNNKILVAGENYIQIKPYVFQSVETGRKCAFQVENGKVIKMSQMLDYLPVSRKDKVRNAATYAVTALSAISFVLAWGRFCMDFLQKKRRKASVFFLLENMLLALIGTDIFIIIGKISAWCRVAELDVYLSGSHILAILLGIITLSGLVKGYKNREKGNCLYQMYAIVLLLVLCFAVRWELV